MDPETSVRGPASQSDFTDRITIWNCDTYASHDHAERGCKGATYLREGIFSEEVLFGWPSWRRLVGPWEKMGAGANLNPAEGQRPLRINGIKAAEFIKRAYGLGADLRGPGRFDLNDPVQTELRHIKGWIEMAERDALDARRAAR